MRRWHYVTFLVLLVAMGVAWWAFLTGTPIMGFDLSRLAFRLMGGASIMSMAVSSVVVLLWASYLGELGFRAVVGGLLSLLFSNLLLALAFYPHSGAVGRRIISQLVSFGGKTVSGAVLMALLVASMVVSTARPRGRRAETGEEHPAEEVPEGASEDAFSYYPPSPAPAGGPPGVPREAVKPQIVKYYRRKAHDEVAVSKEPPSIEFKNGMDDKAVELPPMQAKARVNRIADLVRREFRAKNSFFTAMREKMRLAETVKPVLPVPEDTYPSYYPNDGWDHEEGLVPHTAGAEVQEQGVFGGYLIKTKAEKNKSPKDSTSQRRPQEPDGSPKRRPGVEKKGHLLIEDEGWGSVVESLPEAERKPPENAVQKPYGGDADTHEREEEEEYEEYEEEREGKYEHEEEGAPEGEEAYEEDEIRQEEREGKSAADVGEEPATLREGEEGEEGELEPERGGLKVATYQDVSINWEGKLPPPIDLLYKPPHKEGLSKAFIDSKAAAILKTFESFKVPVDLVGISVGPSVIRFEIKIPPGIKVRRVFELQQDIALALAVPKVRIEAPIPGKTAIGIEVPRESRETIYLREVIESKAYRFSKATVPVILGVDVEGKSWVADLTEMPHLLVAGATGSGKSVFLNSLILGAIYKLTPTDLRFILVDPKKVEFAFYEGIPYLLAPVVTDPKVAADVLEWAVSEMEQRYEKFSAIKARNILSYNRRVPKEERMPYIVVVIDELADLMVTSAKKVEESIMRMAQMARATGIHLVLATQRPSVDVITGLIKANIPTRVAFAVSSATDSRTVLDMTGAEALTGKGDMLYLPVGRRKPVRIQAPYVSEDEVKQVAKYLGSLPKPPMASIGGDEDMTSEDLSPRTIREDPKVLRKAAELVVGSGLGSISFLQRKLGLGFSRAARIMDILERMGIVGPSEGSKPRKVLIGPEELEDILRQHGV